MIEGGESPQQFIQQKIEARQIEGLTVEQAGKAAENLAEIMGAPNEWVKYLARPEKKGSWWNTGPKGEIAPTQEGQVLAEALTGLAESEVVMDEVLKVVDMFAARKGGSTDVWVKESTWATRSAMRTLVDGMVDEVVDQRFCSDEKAQRVLNNPDGTLQLVGYAYGDSLTANKDNQEKFFGNATHPALKEVARRRQASNELKATTSVAVRDDLAITPGWGKVKA